jgi:pimeloyl-ACP methyl ester carboxylesterase
VIVVAVAPASVAAPAPGRRASWDADGPADARPIVLLHGAILSRTMWRPLVALLQDRYRCISVDLPGHGVLAGEPFTMDAAVAQVSEIIDREAGGRALVMGLSLGGYVAMAVAGAAPARVRGLVVAGATLEPRGIWALAFLAFGLALRILPERLIRAVDVELMRRLYGRAVVDEVLAGGYFARGGGVAVTRLAGGRFRALLQAYGGAILVINGGRDFVFSRTEHHFLDGLPRVRTLELAGASHLSTLDRPAEVAAAVQAFEEALDP